MPTPPPETTSAIIVIDSDSDSSGVECVPGPSNHQHQNVMDIDNGYGEPGEIVMGGYHRHHPLKRRMTVVEPWKTLTIPNSSNQAKRRKGETISERPPPTVVVDDLTMDEVRADVRRFASNFSDLVTFEIPPPPLAIKILDSFSTQTG